MDHTTIYTIDELHFPAKKTGSQSLSSFKKVSSQSSTFSAGDWEPFPSVGDNHLVVPIYVKLFSADDFEPSPILLSKKSTEVSFFITWLDYICHRQNTSLIKISLPGLPHVRLIADSRLLSVADDWLLQDALVLKNFFFFILGHKVFDQCQQVLVLAIFINHCLQAADCLADLAEFSLAQAFFFEINKLILDPSFLEIPLRLAGIRAFLCTENLNIHSILLPTQPADWLYMVIF